MVTEWKRMKGRKREEMKKLTTGRKGVKKRRNSDKVQVNKRKKKQRKDKKDDREKK